MKFPTLILTLMVVAQSAIATELPADRLKQLADAVSASRLQNSINSLVGFGTRHTLSDAGDPTRGIGAARRWAAEQFLALARACGGCLQLSEPAELVTGKRVPEPTEIVNIMAVQVGTSDPDRVVIIAGHIDSRATDVMDKESDAPGANDDGSGVAAVLEAARLLSPHKFAATIVYAVLSGEEQGLYGGKLLASTAAERGWQVEAMLNNDIIGNVEGQNGRIDADHFRLFSEAKRHPRGGDEADGPSRNLARLVAELTAAVLPDFHPRLIFRADRLGRGGDQLPMQDAGYPAIRLTEAAENYRRQHQDVRAVDGTAFGDVASGVDFPYLVHMTAVNVVALADMAWAPAPPAGVTLAGAVSADSTLTWSATPGEAGYWARWRASDAAGWQQQRFLGDATTVVLKDLVADDWVFGVSAASSEGFVSPTSSAETR